ncbi:hypothetical protein PVAG01_01739 [Phlyctema vagabunda]|uniref:Uncharacterized protein n=1 Tax=Phlyctema vagabunda TaxID=108571 RepID=A0ABR4PXY7_9HELO
MRLAINLALAGPLFALTWAQTTYYTVLFAADSVGPQYGITNFESTMVVPPTSAGAGFHSAWPGLEPSTEDFVYQNVLMDSGQQWYFFAEYCCEPRLDYPPQPVYPGDTIRSIFSLDTSSGEWANAWSSVPGQAGIEAGEAIGSIVNTNSFPDEGILSQAIFAIELQEGAVWDFGAVAWSDITIVANTTSTAWCSSPGVFGGFKYSMSTPVATVAGGSTTCYIESLIFEAP